MQELLENASSQFTLADLPFLLLNLVLAASLATLLRWHYVKYGRSLGNRAEFARNFVTISLAIVLIISVVKSSLALSLGLVGALSIVRFRTPIKDPEELSYLFLAIALGLGLGANQLLTTVASFGFILLVLAARAHATKTVESHALYLEVDIPKAADPAPALDELTDIVRRGTDRSKLRRMESDSRSPQLLASYAVVCRDRRAMTAVIDSIHEAWPEARITLLDQEQVPGV